MYRKGMFCATCTLFQSYRIIPSTSIDLKSAQRSVWLSWLKYRALECIIAKHCICARIHQVQYYVIPFFWNSLSEMSQEDKHKEPIRKQSKQDAGPHHETPPVKHILATIDHGSSDEDSESKDSFPDMWGPPPAATASVSVSQGPPTTANPGDRRKLSKNDSRTEANFLIDEHFAGLADPQVDVANWPLFTEVSGACYYTVPCEFLRVLCSS